MTSLSSEYMDVKVTDPGRSEEPAPAVSNTTADNCKRDTEDTQDRGDKEKDNSRSLAGVAEEKSRLPSAETQTDNDKTNTSIDNSTESALELEPKAHVEKTQKREASCVDSGAVKGEANSMGGETAVAQEKDLKIQKVVCKDKDIQKDSDPDSTMEKEGDETLTLCSEDVKAMGSSHSSVWVEEDGSIFIKVDKDCTETRSLEEMAKPPQQKGTKIQFSNQLAFSLD